FLLGPQLPGRYVAGAVVGVRGPLRRDQRGSLDGRHAGQRLARIHREAVEQHVDVRGDPVAGRVAGGDRDREDGLQLVQACPGGGGGDQDLGVQQAFGVEETTQVGGA